MSTTTLPPYTFSEFPVPNTAYCDETDVQALLMGMKVNNPRATQPEQGSVANIRQFCLQVAREIDAVLQEAGAVVPPPAGAPILPILQQTAAYGAAAQLELARHDTGDQNLGAHARLLVAMYDNMLGLIERGDLNLIDMGMQSRGWAVTNDRRKRYFSGTLQPNPDGSAKGPAFTMQTQW